MRRNIQGVEELQSEFLSGEFDFHQEEFIVSGIKYMLMKAEAAPFDEYMNGSSKPAIVYTAGAKQKNSAVERGLAEWLVFVWGVQANSLVPAGIKPTTSARFHHTMTREGEEIDEAVEQDPNHIGHVTDIKFTQLPGSPVLKAKVDTGATISSLHAERWQQKGDQISFICPEISKSVLTVPMTDQQAVKSADGGTEYRPVIETNVNVNGKTLTGVKFNLNDRSQMQYPVLVGKNILEQGGFLVNVKLEDEEGEEELMLTEADWKHIQEEIADINLPEPVDAYTEEDMSALMKLLSESNITFAEIVRHLRGEITESVKHIEY